MHSKTTYSWDTDGEQIIVHLPVEDMSNRQEPTEFKKAVDALFNGSAKHVKTNAFATWDIVYPLTRDNAEAATSELHQRNSHSQIGILSKHLYTSLYFKHRFTSRKTSFGQKQTRIFEQFCEACRDCFQWSAVQWDTADEAASRRRAAKMRAGWGYISRWDSYEKGFGEYSAALHYLKKHAEEFGVDNLKKKAAHYKHQAAIHAEDGTEFGRQWVAHCNLVVWTCRYQIAIVEGRERKLDKLED